MVEKNLIGTPNLELPLTESATLKSLIKGENSHKSVGSTYGLLRTYSLCTGEHQTCFGEDR